MTYLDLHRELAETRGKLYDMEKEALKLMKENARLREALALIAMPIRSDGTYNRSREACEKLAREALEEV